MGDKENLVITGYPLIQKLTDWLQGAGVQIDTVERIVIDIPFDDVPTITLYRYVDERWLHTTLEGLKADEIKVVSDNDYEKGMGKHENCGGCGD